jgi:hypothetical protein
MPTIEQTIDCYIATWNETDSVRRRALIDQALTADATYVDPLMRGDSLAEIDDMIAGAQQQLPGLMMLLSGPIDLHNDRVRFGWALAPVGGDSPVIAGTDFSTVAPDGRLQSVTGFI